MSRPTALSSLTGLGRQASSGLTAALLMALPSIAAPVSLYPPAAQFRSLQLTTLACGRDNDTVSCNKARAMADPLLDHPRLSASCKDSLWAIRQKAVASAANSPERRDAIDRAAKDVTQLCRQPTKPTSAGQGTEGSGGGSPFSAPAPR